MLDETTAGLIAIQRCGGVTVVQEPKDAAYPEMPQSALSNLTVDHCVPPGGNGTAAWKTGLYTCWQRRAVPDDIRTEPEIAERVLSDIAQVTSGQQYRADSIATDASGRPRRMRNVVAWLPMPRASVSSTGMAPNPGTDCEFNFMSVADRGASFGRL